MIETIKKAALDAVIASNPAGVVFGTVKAVSPLSVDVEQRLTLNEEHLILTSLVSDFDIDMILNHTTESTSGGSGDSSFSSHNHAVTGLKTMTVHLGLEVGEKVIMIRVQGGQKYIVLDRVR